MGNWYEYDFSGKRVLLVEDHPVNAWVEQRILEKVGFAVEIAENGKKGVDKYLESGDEYYDAVLMDINMPVMDGLTAARLIRSMSVKGADSIPIIAMTTNGYEEDISRSLEAGMNEHLIKPVEPEVLLQCLLHFMK